MIRRLLGLTALWVAMAVPASAQMLGYGSLGALNAVVAINPGAILGATISVSGVYSGTVSFQCDPNGGGTYTNVLATNLLDGSATATTTTTGVWFIPQAGCVSIQAKMTAYTSGAAAITMTRAYQFARLYQPVFGSVQLSAGGGVKSSTGPSTCISGPDNGCYLNVLAGQVFINSATLAFGTSGTPDVVFTRAAANELTWPAVLFASLGTPANGTMVFCSDCTIAATCAGSGTGALAKRLNGAWVCN